MNMRQFKFAGIAAFSIVAAAPIVAAQDTAPSVEPPPPQEQQIPDEQTLDEQTLDEQTADEEAANAIMDEDYVRSMLETLGMEDIRDFERDGTYYTTVATWFGEESELRIDARTGEVVEPTQLSEKQISQSLRQVQRFEEVLTVEPDGDFYRVVAVRGGFEYDLRVDARTGDVVNLTAR